ncbi:zona pellucida sperm-binding protein 4 [Callorhinchus milii]|uniref:zona pellucida sperm-binding protein 4 n=1 Tax=Callorhinchus milii TaxID=7868 RepID=UPI001C3FF161|nr:zona pellucida sperm-binding protein 4 [Callorhinchus milii]
MVLTGGIARIHLPVNGVSPAQLEALSPPSQKVADEGDTCDVDAQHRIACGNPAISEVACHLKGCCFDAPSAGTPCFYGRTERVECTRDLFSIVIPKDVTVPPLNLSSVSLANGRASECSPKVRTAAFIVFRFPVSACGTTQVFDGQTITYETDVIAEREILDGPSGVITRDSTYRLHVECRFAGDAELPFQVLVNTPAPPSLVVKAGVLNMEMRIAKEQLYSTWYAKADYPVLKFLRQPVFVEVRVLNRTDAHINLMLYDCWATPSPDSDHRTQWRILVNGCPYYGDNYLTRLHRVNRSSEVPFPTHRKRFELKTFGFWDSKIQNLLHGKDSKEKQKLMFKVNLSKDDW